jgi:hypothetical protein
LLQEDGEVLPAIALNVPAGHCVQLVDPGALQLPREQHTPDPKELKVEAPQLLQVFDPLDALKVLYGHKLQMLWADAELKLPMLQSLQTAAPSELQDPAGQAVQEVLEVPPELGLK